MGSNFRRFKLDKGGVMPFALMSHLEGKEDRRTTAWARKADAKREAEYYQERGHEVRITKTFGGKWQVWRF